MASTLEAIKNRLSTRKFDSTKEISKADIEKLISYAIEAPSSFNIQHWRFIAVTNKADKEKLCRLSYNQIQIKDASVVFIVLGDKKAHENIKSMLDKCLQNGSLNEKAVAAWSGMIPGFYKNESMARDEAIRSCSLACMNLMLAAYDMGMTSCPMIGFDSKGVMEEYGISERYLPVMLLPVGYSALDDDTKRKARHDLSEVLIFDKEKQFNN